MSHGNAVVVTRPSGADASERGRAAQFRGNLHEGIALVAARAAVLLAAARLNTETMVGGVLHPGVLLDAPLARFAGVRDVVLFDVALSDALPCQRNHEDDTQGSIRSAPERADRRARRGSQATAVPRGSRAGPCGDLHQGPARETSP